MAEKTRILAVGGESHAAPRDTLPAYWGALGAGADALIVGVQLTSDGVVVCCGASSLSETTGEDSAVGDVTAAELARMDAGAVFRSTELGDHNQPIGQGDDTPWDGKSQRRLYHPTLEELLRVFGRRTEIMLHALAPAGGADVLAAALAEVLGSFGLSDGIAVAGDEPALEAVRSASPASPLVYRAGEGEDAATAQGKAADLGCAAAIVDGESLGDGAQAEPALIVASRTMPHALSPEAFTRVSRTPAVTGLACRAIHETRALFHETGLVASDDFAGTRMNTRLWSCGYSKVNQDTEISQNDGLHIRIKEGGEYSGAAALTTYAIVGPFDATVDFEVENPHQGTTFEVAAIQVDPGYHHPDNSDLNRRSVNLTFDVHGAPPYASSERDENDGFRIGWNNGPAVTRFEGYDAQSSNIYNKYSRDVGDGGLDNPKGSLRLVRNGPIFNAYYRDKHNRAWVLSGSADVSTLAPAVWLRLAAKHWPKRGKTPPKNTIHFYNFELRQP